MQIQYRSAGLISPMGQVFLSEIPDQIRVLYEEPLKRFESVSLISSFEDSLCVFPFTLEEEQKKKLEVVHKYIRQVALGQIAEELLYKASMEKRDSLEATRLLLEVMRDQGGVSGDLANQLIFNYNKG